MEKKSEQELTEQEKNLDAKFVNKVALRKISPSVFALSRNGAPMPCAFKQPIISQQFVTKKKTIATMNEEPEQELVTSKEVLFCTSQCPLFNFEDPKQGQAGGIIVQLCCGNSHAHYKIDTIIPYVAQEANNAPSSAESASMKKV